MRTLIAGVVFLAATLLALAIGPALAAEAAGAAVTVAPMHLDFSPLIPVINGLIVAVAGVISAMVPVVVGYGVLWMRQHGIAVSQAAQKIISERITATIQNGLKYATAGADEQVSKLKIAVSNPTVAAAANYAIAQSPVLLKQAGIDVTTEAGQQTLVRRITAESMPTPPALAPASTVNVTSDAPAHVGGATPGKS